MVNTSTREFTIHELVIINSVGDMRSLSGGGSKLWNVINIYEDIFSPVVSGSIQLIDGVDLFSSMSMHGNEFLKISFSRPGNDSASERYNRTFRIYKASERKPEGGAQSYVLHFCSEELIFSNQLTLSRKLKNASATEHVINICLTDLHSNAARVNLGNFEQSIGTTDLILTQYKPFEAIEYLSSRAYNDNESTFLFFENKYGYNFMSLETLFTRKQPISKINYNTAKFTQDQSTAAYANANDIVNFRFAKSFDVLDGTKSSTYNGRMFTLDLVTQKYKMIDYSLVNARNQRQLMDGFFPLNEAKNRNDIPLFAEFGTEVNYSLTNLGRNNNSYFISKGIRSIDTNVEKTLLQRKVQLNLLRSTELQCIVPANQLYTVGSMIEFEMPAFMPNTETERKIDPYHSGKYLITGVRHVITESSGSQTLLQLCKNSIAVPFDTPGNNNAYNIARNF